MLDFVKLRTQNLKVLLNYRVLILSLSLKILNYKNYKNYLKLLLLYKHKCTCILKVLNTFIKVSCIMLLISTSIAIFKSLIYCE